MPGFRKTFRVCLLLLLALARAGQSEEGVPTAVRIPDAEIAALEDELAQGRRGTSAVDVRRVCKSVIRKAESLLEAAPDAPNRYELLDVLFQSQKRLLSLEFTEQNREAVFETCGKLLDAPDQHAELRLEADMLLSERELARGEATVDERVKALEAMLTRYRGTSAEWKSLVLGSMSAAALFEFDLVQKIRDTMQERFAGDHRAIEFRRESNPGAAIESVFSGTYETADGSRLAFPFDRLGHQSLMVFWSRETPAIEDHLGAVRDVQIRHPGRLEVYSFNVDELPDAGEKTLRGMTLDWTALHLPGGRRNSAYRAYGEADPNTLFVNAQGHALLVSPPARAGASARQIPLGGWNLSRIAGLPDGDRYLAQLRSLFVGDFLVAASASGGDPSAAGVTEPAPGAGVAIPLAALQSIQACFPQPPRRYRLTLEEELANYRKAEQLSREALQRHADAADLWRVRNGRIIALIGLWNLERDPKRLEEAVEEAQIVLGTTLPPGADVAARFCLAKEALRRSGVDPEAVLAGFIRDAGGDKAPPIALAAAAVLAVEANARSAHETLRRRLFDAGGDEVPALWPVLAFLRDRHHRYRNFWASPGGHGYGRPQKYEFRDMLSGLAEPGDGRRRLAFEMTMPDGGTFKAPEAAEGEMLGVVFVEPPAEAQARSALATRVSGFASGYVRQGVKVVVAVLSDDKNLVSSLIEGIDVEVQHGIVPGGLENPVVRQLGILSADRIPNPLLFRPDGTVAWTLSGLEYRAFQEGPDYAIALAIGTNIAKVRSDVAFHALEQGDFAAALGLFSEHLPPRAKHDWWTADRLHGRALASMGLRDWDAALRDIEGAIERRLADFKSSVCKCHGVVEMLLTQAAILEELGRDREAATARQRAGQERIPHSELPPGPARGGVPVGVYYDWLRRIRLALQDEEGSVTRER